MNKNIRVGAFETNSSSTHSICIAQGEARDTLGMHNGKCQVFPGEFGWEQQTHYDAATKASYAYTYAATDEAQMQMLREVIAEHMNIAQEAVEFVRNPGTDYFSYPTGYIDHQSNKGEGDACGPAFESKDALRRFIFCPSSHVETDNDNH